MDTAVVRQFLDFFQDFINLCHSANWPDNTTSETEIQNAFLVAEHVEKCLNKLQKRTILNDFLSNISNTQDLHHTTLKRCLSDPSKYVLKKVVNSNTNIQQLDITFKVFVEIFSEEKLEQCLADIMLETASKQTLLNNMSREIPKQKILGFKSQIFLSELNNCNEPKETILTMFSDCNQDTVDLLVVSMTNNNLQNHKSISCIVKLLIDITRSKRHDHKKFWKYLFNVEETYFLEMCTRHSDWFKIIVQALLDCGKLLQENMSAEYFYIDLTYSELVSNVRKICHNECLRIEFFDIVKECDIDTTFWDNLIK
ncbi:unnamed protein product [Chilo suppressalis]|uniref:DUF4371 domain-containing protein n=1 Tax=Chilo suppressalis TaxID=168631 RepID=A0ABN8AQ88_CHISP|nr:unnamed protein product [Chilo suppressalis]